MTTNGYWWRAKGTSDWFPILIGRRKRVPIGDDRPAHKHIRAGAGRADSNRTTVFPPPHSAQHSHNTLIMEFNLDFAKALTGEFLVTYLFIFTICMNGIVNPGNAVAGGVSTGFAAIGLIYSFGAISGAHFNPAVTLGAIVGQKIDILKALFYMVGQIAAALAAVATVGFFAPGSIDKLVLAPATGVNVVAALAMEALLTFILVFVIYATAMGVNTEKSLDGDSKSADKAEAKMNFAPIAIGLTLGFLCFLGGSVSGGCFNPARALAPAILSMKFNQVWIYVVGDFIGAGIAAALHTYFFAA